MKIAINDFVKRKGAKWSGLTILNYLSIPVSFTQGNSFDIKNGTLVLMLPKAKAATKTESRADKNYI